MNSLKDVTPSSRTILSMSWAAWSESSRTIMWKA